MLESDHPYGTFCGRDMRLSAGGASFTWLDFDPRCATITAEARLEVSSR